VRYRNDPVDERNNNLIFGSEGRMQRWPNAIVSSQMLVGYSLDFEEYCQE